MWKAVSRTICEAVERRVGFTVFRCDASKSNPQDVQDRHKTRHQACSLQRWHFCQPKHFKSPSLKASKESEGKHGQENRHHENKWDEPFNNRPWVGAMGWSTALFLGWYLCQPFGWCRAFKESCRQYHRCQKNKELSHTPFNNAFLTPAIQPLKILQTNATNKIVDGRQNFGNSSFESADTGVCQDDFDDEHLGSNITSSSASSSDTGVGVDDDELFVHHRGPFTPEEALNEASRVFAAANRSFTGDVENKLGMFYMERNQHAEAMRHFRRASHHDNANAAYNMGQCYELGLGTAQNMKKAAKWYKVASDRGHSIAKYNLAVFFAQGLGGLTEDKQHAYELLRAASNLGLKEAQEALTFVTLQTSTASQESKSNSTEALLNMLGVEDSKPEDLLESTTKYSDVTVSKDVSFIDCMNLSVTSSNEKEYKGTKKPFFYDDFGSRNRWGLNRLCFKLPLDHDTAVA